MKPARPEDLDALIETALEDGALRRAPAGLCRRIKDRVLLLSVIEKERKRFRQSSAAACILTAVAVGAVALLIVAGGFPQIVARGVPGCMGFVDYATASVTHVFSGFAGMMALVFVFPIAAMTIMVLAAIPVLKGAVEAARRGPSGSPEISQDPSTGPRREQ